MMLTIVAVVSECLLHDSGQWLTAEEPFFVCTSVQDYEHSELEFSLQWRMQPVQVTQQHHDVDILPSRADQTCCSIHHGLLVDWPVTCCHSLVGTALVTPKVTARLALYVHLRVTVLLLLLLSSKLV